MRTRVRDDQVRLPTNRRLSPFRPPDRAVAGHAVASRRRRSRRSPAPGAHRPRVLKPSALNPSGPSRAVMSRGPRLTISRRWRTGLTATTSPRRSHPSPRRRLMLISLIERPRGGPSKNRARRVPLRPTRRSPPRHQNFATRPPHRATTIQMSQPTLTRRSAVTHRVSELLEWPVLSVLLERPEPQQRRQARERARAPRRRYSELPTSPQRPARGRVG